jgi:hypothetical protein
MKVSRLTVLVLIDLMAVGQMLAVAFFNRKGTYAPHGPWSLSFYVGQRD